MRAGEEMNKQIAGDAASVGLPFAPLEEMFRVEWDVGSRAQKALPVAGLRRSVRRNRVVPRAHGGVAVPVSRHHVELANGAGRKQFLGLFVDDGADALAADLQNALG